MRFFELSDFQPVSTGVLEHGFQIFAGPIHKGGAGSAFEHLIIFHEETLSSGLKKGAFSSQIDSDLAWVLKYARTEERPI